MTSALSFNNLFGPILKLFWRLVWMVLKPVLFILSIFFVLYWFWRLYFRVVKRIKPNPNHRRRWKDDNFFYKLFYLFPRQFALDRLNKDWDEFDKHGIHVFCGEQGSGKTMTMVYMMKKWQYIYPKLLVYSNFEYDDQNGVLTHWKDLIRYENGKFGIINSVDEMQTWFSNAESKDLDPAMIGEVCQQRKQRKVTMGTTQVFSRLAKPLREQVYTFYFPKTFFGCLTVVRYAYGRDYNEKLDKFKRYAGWFFFVQSKELRESYDTYKKISRYVDKELSTSPYWGTPAVVPEPQYPATR